MEVHNSGNITQQINADTVYIGVPQAQPQQAPAQPQPAQTGNGGIQFENCTFNGNTTINNNQK